MKWKKGPWVRKKTYHKLKNLLSKLSRKENLTLEEKNQLEEILKEKEETEEVGPSSSEGSEQIEGDLNTLRDALKDEQVARADAYKKLKEVEERQRKSETELVAERKTSSITFVWNGCIILCDDWRYDGEESQGGFFPAGGTEFYFHLHHASCRHQSDLHGFHHQNCGRQSLQSDRRK